jgi:hypothetical protein
MANFAPALPVLTDFGKVCQIWSCMAHCAKYGGQVKKAYKDPICPVVAKYDQLYPNITSNITEKCTEIV